MRGPPRPSRVVVGLAALDPPYTIDRSTISIYPPVVSLRRKNRRSFFPSPSSTRHAARRIPGPVPASAWGGVVDMRDVPEGSPKNLGDSPCRAPKDFGENGKSVKKGYAKR